MSNIFFIFFPSYKSETVIIKMALIVDISNAVPTVCYLLSLALALQFLRSKGIAHMDLKPQNLLLTGDRKILLKVGGTVCMFCYGCIVK